MGDLLTLVVDPTPLKNVSSSVGYMENSIHVPKHQAVFKLPSGTARNWAKLVTFNTIGIDVDTMGISWKIDGLEWNCHGCTFW